jgi:anti-anti-sigma factor
VREDQFSYDLDQSRGVLTLRGELDEIATVELRDVLTKVTDDYSADLAIDLENVTFMPSPAIGVLASSREKERRNGAELTFVAPAGTIAARLLTICGIEHVEALEAP